MMEILLSAILVSVIFIAIFMRIIISQNKESQTLLRFQISHLYDLNNYFRREGFVKLTAKKKKKPA